MTETRSIVTADATERVPPAGEIKSLRLKLLNG